LQLVELTYRGGGVSMVVLLPREIDGLKALENSLNQKQLDDWIAHARVEKVSVFLPKFKLTRQFELGKTLAGMGMADAFSPRADFSGMDGMKDLFISEVIHKAFVEVNEEGTEAAAATAAVMVGMAMQRPQPAPVFRADHPFLFLIRDTHSGSILFMGRVTNPAK
jgi:serpin B